MRLNSKNINRLERPNARRHAMRGFTLAETVMTIALVVMLSVSSLATILEMQVSSKRVADYTSAMAVAEAKLQDIRAITYNPPNYPFIYGTVYLTNQNSISLSQAGTTFQIPGTAIVKIDYQGSVGHLVTVTATFQTTRKPLTATLQTVVNAYSGGQQ